MSDTTKFRELSTHVVELLGGSDNIEQFAHCVTRLRFNVRDTTKVQAAEIEKLGGVLGTPAPCASARSSRRRST